MIEPVTIKEATWWKLICLLFMAVLLSAKYEDFLPASHWMSVKQVHVFDTTEGVSPRMEVKRTIRRSFQARWTVELEKWNGRRFVLQPRCNGSGISNYSAENDLPSGDELNLAWWRNAPPCLVAPAQYRVETRWVLNNGKEILNTSNMFWVHPAN